MATWQAEVWEYNVGHYDVEVQAPTWGTARQKICDIYCVSPSEVVNLREKNGWGSESLDNTDLGGTIVLCAIVLILWAIIEYWYIAVPIIVFLVLGWIAQLTQHWWDR